MKILFKIISALLITSVIFSSQSLAKDKEFSGIIVYNISYPDSDIDPQMQSMMPKTMKMKIKENFLRTEISMGMGSNVIIYNAEERNGVTLLDIMGQKFAIDISSDEIEKELSDGPEVNVEITDETKEIAGYLCKKAILKVKEKESEKITEHYVYFTEKLGSGKFNFNNPLFKDIKGRMMEYVITESDMNMVFTAVSVEKKKISDDEFTAPDDYKKITRSELESMMGGY